MGWLKKEEVKSKMKEKVVKTKNVAEPEPEEELAEVLDEEVEEEEDEEDPTPAPIVQPALKKTNVGWTVVDIPTASVPMIVDPKTNKQLNIYQALAELLNRTQD